MSPVPADPLYAAIGDALTRHGPTSHAAIQAAATAARQVLGTDRCTCRASTHHQHHTTPVTGCPWCAATNPAGHTPTPQAITIVPVIGGAL